MTDSTRKTVWMLVGAGSAAIAGALVQSALEGGWRLATGEDAPADPDARDTSWGEALAWAAGTAAVAAAAQLLARRGARAGWTRITGERPPGRKR